MHEGDRIIDPMPFSLSEWHYFGITEDSDNSKSTKKLFINTQISASVTSNAVINGPPNGTLFIGSNAGLIKFFVGFIWEFDYYTYADAEEFFGNCASMCMFCPLGGCLPTCDVTQYVDDNEV
jgi:hypothetical protein